MMPIKWFYFSHRFIRDILRSHILSHEYLISIAQTKKPKQFQLFKIITFLQNNEMRVFSSLSQNIFVETAPSDFQSIK